MPVQEREIIKSAGLDNCKCPSCGAKLDFIGAFDVFFQQVVEFLRQEAPVRIRLLGTFRVTKTKARDLVSTMVENSKVDGITKTVRFSQGTPLRRALNPHKIKYLQPSKRKAMEEELAQDARDRGRDIRDN